MGMTFGEAYAMLDEKRNLSTFQTIPVEADTVIKDQMPNPALWSK